MYYTYRQFPEIRKSVTASETATVSRVGSNDTYDSYSFRPASASILYFPNSRTSNISRPKTPCSPKSKEYDLSKKLNNLCRSSVGEFNGMQEIRKLISEQRISEKRASTQLVTNSKNSYKAKSMGECFEVPPVKTATEQLMKASSLESALEKLSKAGLSAGRSPRNSHAANRLPPGLLAVLGENESKVVEPNTLKKKLLEVMGIALSSEEVNAIHAELYSKTSK